MAEIAAQTLSLSWNQQLYVAAVGTGQRAACLPRAGREGDWKVTRHARPHREPRLEPAAIFHRWLGPSCRADPQHPPGPHQLPRECSPESALA